MCNCTLSAPWQQVYKGTRFEGSSFLEWEVCHWGATRFPCALYGRSRAVEETKFHASMLDASLCISGSKFMDLRPTITIRVTCPSWTLPRVVQRHLSSWCFAIGGQQLRQRTLVSAVCARNYHNVNVPIVCARASQQYWSWNAKSESKAERLAWISRRQRIEHRYSKYS